MNICELLNENELLTREEITYKYDFDIRQTNYYTDACRYLGLVDKERDRVEGVKYYLSDKGKSIFKLNLKDRNLAFVKCILEKELLRKLSDHTYLNWNYLQKRNCKNNGTFGTV